jgi:hypothetical protein
MRIRRDAHFAYWVKGASHVEPTNPDHPAAYLAYPAYPAGYGDLFVDRSVSP